jgi:predicted alpha/beta-fold hydrolase
MLVDLPPFRPHPLVRGGHLQTIAGCYWPSPQGVRGAEHRAALPDGDAIALHDDGPDSAPIVALMVHGLGGCARSSYMLRCSAKLRARGVRVFRMDLRGCGAGLAHARQPLHAGRSEDAAAAFGYVSEQCPGVPIHLVGFSMGANIVLKLVGELGAGAPARLASVMAVSPPIDLVACSHNMQRGWNSAYDRRFVRTLLRHVGERIRTVPDVLTRPLDPRPNKLMDFDSRFTAPLSGFADVHDYYTRASSGPLLPHITVPTLIIAAASDPIVPIKPFEAAAYSPTTQLVVTPCGGHLGFVAARGIDPDRRWLDWRVVDWVLSQRALEKHSIAERPAPDAHLVPAIAMEWQS